MSLSIAREIDYRSFPVLYVDDEVDNLRTFELAFRHDFTVLRAESGSEALSVLATQPVAVVLSDHRMPGMTGNELLARVREIAPKTVRLLVTAYGDASTLAKAINEGSIYRYVAKPWDVDEMREVVRQAIEIFALEERSESLVGELRALHEANRRLSSQLEIQALSETLVEVVVTDFGFDGATLLLSLEDGRLSPQTCFPALPNDAGTLDDVVLDVSTSEILEPLLSRNPVRIAIESAAGAGNGVRAFASTIAAEEILFVPLTGRHGILGALAVDNRRGGAGFESRQIQLLQSLAIQAAVSVENAQLFGAVRNEIARTSGSDALAISGALGEWILREMSEPLRSLREIVAPAVELEMLSELASRVEVLSEILSEQVPVQCDLGERLSVARTAVKGLSRERGVEVSIEPGDYLKIMALPGKVLQFLIHLLELAVARSRGSVSVSAAGASISVVLPVIAGREAIEEAGPEALKLAACEGLARELGLSIEISTGCGESRWLLCLEG
jgi:CheY-like chemotaxis protein